MVTELNLVENEFNTVEQRKLPRFPLTLLLFRSDKEEHAYEVKDISFTGMQLDMRCSDHHISAGEEIKGKLHWRGLELDIVGLVKWVKESRIGIKFSGNDEFDKKIQEFLSLDNIIAGMRVVHDTHLEMPPLLEFWLRSEGPVELFVWKHPHGAIAKIQFIVMQDFVEWIDGDGLHTGKLLTQRDSDLPLSLEGEFMFEIDRSLDRNKIQFCKELIKKLPAEYLPETVVSFILIKLGE